MLQHFAPIVAADPRDGIVIDSTGAANLHFRARGRCDEYRTAAGNSAAEGAFCIALELSQRRPARAAAAADRWPRSAPTETDHLNRHRAAHPRRSTIARAQSRGRGSRPWVRGGAEDEATSMTAPRRSRPSASRGEPPLSARLDPPFQPSRAASAISRPRRGSEAPRLGRRPLDACVPESCGREADTAIIAQPHSTASPDRTYWRRFRRHRQKLDRSQAGPNVQSQDRLSIQG